MTKNNLQAAHSAHTCEKAKRCFYIIFLLLTVILLITYSADVSAAILQGITLAVRSIIPSLFPFLILSDIFIYQFSEESGALGRIFSKAFGMPPSAISAFLCGCFSGFPVGVKCAAELYSHGDIENSELERLIGFVNNPSPAFVIAAVGTMRGSTREGVILYISVLAATIITGLLFSKRYKSSTVEKRQQLRTKFSLVTSIKNAAYTSIGISAYIIFFSALLGIIDALFVSPEITLIFSLFLEIGNAASLLAKSQLNSATSLALTAFALGFSGISVHMQARSLLPNGIYMKKYIIMKLVVGVAAAAITLLIFNVFY